MSNCLKNGERKLKYVATIINKGVFRIMKGVGMRASLRSLLSYLSSQSEHGPELQSAAVQRLIQHIRSVITRRKLAMPPSSLGSAGDPNSIAEYLDGVLTPERLAEIEELCMASDKYLAEVGACWELLHRDQLAFAPAASFQRMYGLVKEPAAQAQGIPRLIASRAVMVAAAILACLLFALLGWEITSFDGQKTEQSKFGFAAPLPGSHEIVDDVKEETQPRPPGEAQTDPNVLARYSADARDSTAVLFRKSHDSAWHVVAADSPLSKDDVILSPPGFHAPSGLTNGLKIDLLGNWPKESTWDERRILESAITLHANPESDLDVTLHQGRIAIINNKAHGEARARVRFCGETWDLTFSESGSASALELRSYIPHGSMIDKDHHTEDPNSELSLFAIRGRVELKVRYDSYSLQAPPGAALFNWNNVGRISRQAQELKELPPWAAEFANLPNGKPKVISASESVATLQVRLLAGPSPSSVLKDCLKHPDINMRVLAIYSLGAIDQPDVLCDAFGNERQFREVRFASIVAIQNWMSCAADNPQRLFTILEKKYSSATAEIILHLLSGFSNVQLETPEVYASLIVHLKHPDLPVRELAYHQLITLVPEGKTIVYDPAGEKGQRNLAIEEWKKLIPPGSIPAKTKS
jgi:hypothetical protein